MRTGEASHGPSYGFNAATETYEDLVAAGVIDPAKVVRVALQNAASVAGLMLTTECVIGMLESRKPGHRRLPRRRRPRKTTTTTTTTTERWRLR